MTAYVTRMIPLDDLKVDAPKRQRKLRTRRVNQIYRKFDPNALGQGTVSERDNGDLILLDAQHRLEAMRKRINDGLPAPSALECRVFKGLTEEEEARLFLTINETNRPSMLDRWFPRIAAGDEELVGEIATALDKWGWEVSGTTGRGKITAVASLEWVAREGVEVCERLDADINLVDLVLQVITDAWGHESANVNGDLLRGIGALLSANAASGIKLDRLTRKLREFPGQAVGLMSSARANANIRRTSPAMAVADLLTLTYNRGLQNGDLPTWTRRK